jgi:hypothetical protein
MPPGHTIADMADDFARMIAEEFGGRVDVVLGVSYGGMIPQYLPALHPGSVDKVVLVVAAAEVSAWGKAVDSRLAAALARGDPLVAGAALAEVLFAGDHRDQDRFFPRRVVEETAGLIPDCTLIWYEGRGHAGTAASRRVPQDVLAFVNPQ